MKPRHLPYIGNWTLALATIVIYSLTAYVALQRGLQDSTGAHSGTTHTVYDAAEHRQPRPLPGRLHWQILWTHSARSASSH